MRKVSGTARPAVLALACGLMFAAMLGAISATDSPTADQTDSERLSPGPPDGFASIYASLLDFVRRSRTQALAVGLVGGRAVGGERLSPGPPDGFASIYASLLDFESVR